LGLTNCPNTLRKYRLICKEKLKQHRLAVRQFSFGDTRSLLSYSLSSKEKGIPRPDTPSDLHRAQPRSRPQQSCACVKQVALTGASTVRQMSPKAGTIPPPLCPRPPIIDSPTESIGTD
jgi:hypothetical protein